LAVLIITGGVSLAVNSGKSAQVSPVSSKEQQSAPSQPVQNTPAQAPAVTTPAPASQTKYRNGTYTAGGSYISPGGQEHLTVTITVTNDAVTASDLSQIANNRNSANFQSRFKQNYQPLVIGQPLDTIHLDQVSGSSLTSIGFNQALEAIKTQAIGT
jgi:uncharacterized protein with FMN-binding domain